VLCQLDERVKRLVFMASCAWFVLPLDGQRSILNTRDRISAVMDVKLEPLAGFLLATAAGRVSLAEALELGRKVCDAAAERGIDKILVDCLAVEGELSIAGRYELGKTIAEYCRSRSMNHRVAVIGKKPTITGYTARIAANRAGAVQTFSERQTAVDWLDGTSSKATAT
jgi:hypothetical protein